MYLHFVEEDQLGGPRIRRLVPPAPYSFPVLDVSPQNRSLWRQHPKISEIQSWLNSIHFYFYLAGKGSPLTLSRTHNLQAAIPFSLLIDHDVKEKDREAFGKTIGNTKTHRTHHVICFFGSQESPTHHPGQQQQQQPLL